MFLQKLFSKKTTELPRTPKDHLKCTSCKNYLSHFPIHSSVEENICGRCQKPGGKTFIRNEIFESVAQFLKFPCRFEQEGCDQEFTPNELLEHEKDCFYKTLQCPSASFTRCKWEGARSNVLEHCKDKHSDKFVMSEFEIDLSQANQENFFEHDDNLFIVARRYDQSTKTLQIAMYHFDDQPDSRNFPYQIILRNGTRKLMDESHTSCYSDQKFVDINLETLKAAKILAKVIVEEAATFSEDLLNQVKCSSCSKYALPPIYTNGENLIVCELCAEEEDAHSAHLDNIYKLLNYPCKNRSNGCSVVMKPGQIENHQEFCEYKRSYYRCVFERLDCEWVGAFKDIAKHIQEKHPDLVKDNCVEMTESLKDAVIEYVIKIGKNLFKCELDIYEDSCDWRVQVIGDLPMHYNYEIEIIDSQKQGRRFLGEEYCWPYFEGRPNYSVSFTYNQYCYLLGEDEKITFKTCVKKL